MKATITQAEYLQLLGLMALSERSVKSVRDCQSAARSIIGADPNYAGLATDEALEVDGLMYGADSGDDWSPGALDDTLRRLGITVEQADPSVTVGS